MGALMFDTTFLIDFQRERNRQPDRAHRFLQQNSNEVALLPAVACGEFTEGFENPKEPACLSLLSTFEIVPVDAVVAACYAVHARRLRAQGRLIGTNDLWIAATALVQACPLVTRDIEHFARVEGLQLRSY